MLSPFNNFTVEPRPQIIHRPMLMKKNKAVKIDLKSSYLEKNCCCINKLAPTIKKSKTVPMIATCT